MNNEVFGLLHLSLCTGNIRNSWASGNILFGVNIYADRVNDVID